MQVQFFTWNKPKQKTSRSTAATRTQYSIENQYVHVARLVGQVATLRPLDVTARKLCGDPTSTSDLGHKFIPSLPDLILAVVFYFALLSKHTCRTKILNCDVKTSNVIWSVDWAWQKKIVSSSLGRFQKLQKRIEHFDFCKGFVRLYTDITKEGSFPSIWMLVRAI
jgi:hypothetical protein